MKNTLFNELFSCLDDRYTSKSSYPFTKDLGDVYEIEFELAGFSKDDVSIHASEDLLKIKAKSKERSKAYSVNLNSLVAIDHIKSKMANGLLKITLPKKSVAESRMIEIE